MKRPVLPMGILLQPNMLVWTIPLGVLLVSNALWLACLVEKIQHPRFKNLDTISIVLLAVISLPPLLLCSLKWWRTLRRETQQLAQRHAAIERLDKRS